MCSSLHSSASVGCENISSRGKRGHEGQETVKKGGVKVTSKTQGKHTDGREHKIQGENVDKRTKRRPQIWNAGQEAE